MTATEVASTVSAKLAGIEAEHSVEILLAVESGSRAWGFASTDSDYDVRFIYKHQLEWYVSVLARRDVIEYPIEGAMDYSGWDIRKSLFLLNKSNPVLLEWLQSPLVYRQKAGFVKSMSAVVPAYFSRAATIYHYLHMADRNYREYLREDVVRVKKYFYVLRPIFACLWVEQFNSAPPMEFDRLRAAVVSEPALNGEIDSLLERKLAGVELAREPKIPVINEFVETEIARLKETASEYDPREKPDAELLNRLLVSIVSA